MVVVLVDLEREPRQVRPARSDALGQLGDVRRDPVDEYHRRVRAPERLEGLPGRAIYRRTGKPRLAIQPIPQADVRGRVRLHNNQRLARRIVAPHRRRGGGRFT